MLVGIWPAHAIFAEGASDDGYAVAAVEGGENDPAGAGYRPFLLGAYGPLVRLAVFRGDISLRVMWEPRQSGPRSVPLDRRGIEPRAGRPVLGRRGVGDQGDKRDGEQQSHVDRTCFQVSPGPPEKPNSLVVPGTTMCGTSLIFSACPRTLPSVMCTGEMPPLKKDLKELSLVDPRIIWRGEATEFTPWFAAPGSRSK